MHDFDLQDEAGIFGDIRNKHFNVAGGYLNNVISNIQKVISDKNQ